MPRRFPGTNSRWVWWLVAWRWCCKRVHRVAKVLEMNWSWWGDGGAVGSYYSVRLWLLRLGLHQLQAHHERAEDWMWIVDHTMTGSGNA